MSYVIGRGDNGEDVKLRFSTRDLMFIAIAAIVAGAVSTGIGLAAHRGGFVTSGLAVIALALALIWFAPRIVQRKVIAAYRAANGADRG